MSSDSPKKSPRFALWKSRVTSSPDHMPLSLPSPATGLAAFANVTLLTKLLDLVCMLGSTAK